MGTCMTAANVTVEAKEGSLVQREGPFEPGNKPRTICLTVSTCPFAAFASASKAHRSLGALEVRPGVILDLYAFVYLASMQRVR